MIPLPSGGRIYLACSHNDMRRYAEHGIMLSLRRVCERRRGFPLGAAQHNIRHGVSASALR